jgi:hypothetical protein
VTETLADQSLHLGHLINVVVAVRDEDLDSDIDL